MRLTANPPRRPAHVPDQPETVDDLQAQKGDGCTVRPEEVRRHSASLKEAKDRLHTKESHGRATCPGKAGDRPQAIEEAEDGQAFLERLWVNRTTKRGPKKKPVAKEGPLGHMSTELSSENENCGGSLLLSCKVCDKAHCCLNVVDDTNSG